MWQSLKNIYHLTKAIVANIYFGFPGRKLIIIGITGTDGKTTSVNLVYQILKTSGKTVSMVSTVGATIHGKSSSLGFHVTNPASWQLQEFLARAAKSSSQENYLVLEVTSHGIDQNRIWGIPFTIAGLTNITHEHLDYHKTYRNYLETKTRLLQRANAAVVNKDDISFGQVENILKGKGDEKEILTYSLHKKANLTQKDIPYLESLWGEYNQSNALLAASICRYLGISSEEIKKGIETFKFPQGRFEVVYQKDFSVMIDFAHTPNAFMQLLSTLRPKVKGRLIHVFGSAGLRDFTKRPEMGKVAGKYDDIMILTAEDPRTEKIQAINIAIRAGIKKRHSKIRNDELPLVLEIPDRQEAITKAIAMAKKGDLVVITGKAHEQSMNLGHGEILWSDYTATKKALAAKEKGNRNNGK